MARPKLSPAEIRVPAPIRMRPPYLAKLREIARAFGISPGQWVEVQLERFMPAASQDADKGKR